MTGADPSLRGWAGPEGRRDPAGRGFPDASTRGVLRRGRRALLRHRRAVMAALVVLAVASGFAALAPVPAPGVWVVAATRDLPAGTRIDDGDVTLRRLSRADAAPGALSSLARARGALLASAVGAAEVLTDARLVGPSLLDASPAGTVAVPVRLAEPGLGALVRAGSLVDVMSTAALDPTASLDLGSGLTQSGAARAPISTAVVAAGVRVLAVASSAQSGGLTSDPGSGTLLVLATDEATAVRLADASATSRLSVALRR